MKRGAVPVGKEGNIPGKCPGTPKSEHHPPVRRKALMKESIAPAVFCTGIHEESILWVNHAPAGSNVEASSIKGWLRWKQVRMTKHSTYGWQAHHNHYRRDWCISKSETFWFASTKNHRSFAPKNSVSGWSRTKRGLVHETSGHFNPDATGMPSSWSLFSS